MSIFLKTKIKTRKTDLLLKEDIPVHNFSQSALLEIEKEILGIYVSTHPLTIYRQNLPDRTPQGQIYIRSHHIGQTRPRQPILIAGLLVQVRRQFTKHNQVMAFLLLEDETGLFEAIAFPEVFHRYFALLSKDALLLIKGSTSDKKEEEKIVIQEIKNINHYF